MKIACLTGGGDAPGLNAVLRGLVLQGTLGGATFTAYLRGWKGLIDGSKRPLTAEDVADIHRQGGTIILSSRTNPAKIENGYEIVKKRLKEDGIDCLVAIGGEDTLGVANKLHGEHGMRVIGVPKTIDNDLSATDFTFGFDTAINIAMDCLDKLHTTAFSHERVLVVEIMGRHAGWMALEAGIAGGAHVILIPEKKFSVKEVCDVIQKRYASGKRYALVAVAEGAEPADPSELADAKDAELDSFGHVKLGGIAERLAKAIEKRTKAETRHTVLGHIQRGGPPTAFDRVLGTRLGQEAAKLALSGKSGQMVGLRGTDIVAVPLKEAVSKLKTVPLLDTKTPGPFSAENLIQSAVPMPTTKVQKIRIYETYMVLDTIVTKEQQDALVAKIKRAVEDVGGKFLLEVSRGKRKLSYVLKKRTEALHVVTYSEGPGGIPAEIAQVLRFDPLVLRAQTFVVEKVADPQAEAAEAAVSSTSPEPSDPAYQDSRDGEL